MTRILFFIFLTSISFPSLAADLTNGNTKNVMTMNVIESAKGDLNHDGIDDEVITKSECGDCFDWDSETPPQKVVEVYLSNAKTKNRDLAESSRTAICYNCGGIKGFKIIGTPEISKKGVLTMIYSGGSRYMWENQLKWRLNTKTKKLELIGETVINTDTLREDGEWDPEDSGATISEDINFMTGKAIIKKMGPKKKVITQECLLGKDLKLPDFPDFDFEKFTETPQSMQCPDAPARNL